MYHQKRRTDEKKKGKKSSNKNGVVWIPVFKALSMAIVKTKGWSMSMTLSLSLTHTRTRWRNTCPGSYGNRHTPFSALSHPECSTLIHRLLVCGSVIVERCWPLTIAQTPDAIVENLTHRHGWVRCFNGMIPPLLTPQTYCHHSSAVSALPWSGWWWVPSLFPGTDSGSTTTATRRKCLLKINKGNDEWILARFLEGEGNYSGGGVNYCKGQNKLLYKATWMAQWHSM